MSCPVCAIAEVSGNVQGPGSGLIAASRAAVLTLGRVLSLRTTDHYVLASDLTRDLCRDHRAQVTTARDATPRAAEQLALGSKDGGK